jgi:hypothetical protein
MAAREGVHDLRAAWDPRVPSENRGSLESRRAHCHRLAYNSNRNALRRSYHQGSATLQAPSGGKFDRHPMPQGKESRGFICSLHS